MQTKKNHRECLIHDGFELTNRKKNKCLTLQKYKLLVYLQNFLQLFFRHTQNLLREIMQLSKKYPRIVLDVCFV